MEFVHTEIEGLTTATARLRSCG